MARRNRLLAEGRAEPAWLAGLEDGMARHAVAATAGTARPGGPAECAAGQRRRRPFPAGAAFPDLPDRRPAGPVAGPGGRGLAARGAWRRRGRADAAAGSASLGAHRADLALADLASGRPAALASTGQQKALLLGVVLGHALAIAEARGFGPWLLLDEPLVHLDESHRAALLEALLNMRCQVFLTGVDAEPLALLRDRAEFSLCMAAGLTPNPGFARPKRQELL